MKKEVIYSPDAFSDIEEIRAYISDVLSNPQSAQRTVERIVSEADRLADNPEIGPKVSSRFGINTEYRFLVA